MSILLSGVKSWMDPSCRKSLGFDPIPLGSLGSIFEATKIHDPKTKDNQNQQNRLHQVENFDLLKVVEQQMNNIPQMAVFSWWFTMVETKKSQVNENNAKKKHPFPKKQHHLESSSPSTKRGKFFLGACHTACHCVTWWKGGTILRFKSFLMKSFPEDWFVSRNKFQVFLLVSKFS